MTRTQVLLQNYQRILDAFEKACKRAQRDVKQVTLLAVTKYAADQDVLALLEQGVLSHIGESRVQQAWARWQENPAFAAYSNVEKHLIGHLQKNKAAKAARLFDWIDSLDDFETAQLLAKYLPTGKTLHALVQVKLTQKENQYGLPLEKARVLARQLKGTFKNIDVCGYMAVAPQGADTATLRSLFKPLKQAFDTDFATHPLAQLSLGMSEDFIIAVEEGSTLPRIGSLLFSQPMEGI